MLLMATACSSAAVAAVKRHCCDPVTLPCSFGRCLFSRGFVRRVGPGSAAVKHQCEQKEWCNCQFSGADHHHCPMLPCSTPLPNSAECLHPTTAQSGTTAWPPPADKGQQNTPPDLAASAALAGCQWWPQANSGRCAAMPITWCSVCQRVAAHPHAIVVLHSRPTPNMLLLLMALQVGG